MKFSINKDKAFVAISISLFLVAILLWIAGIKASGLTSFIALFLGSSSLLAGGFLTWALLHSYIEVTDEYVIHHFGLFETRVTLDRIREVRVLKDSTPALCTSVIRMQLWLYPQEVVTITSVKEEKEFFEALQQKLPTVYIANNKAMI